MHIPGTATHDETMCTYGDPGAPVSRNRRLLFEGVSDRTGASTVNDELGTSSVDGAGKSSTGDSLIGRSAIGDSWIVALSDETELA